MSDNEGLLNRWSLVFIFTTFTAASFLSFYSFAPIGIFSNEVPQFLINVTVVNGTLTAEVSPPAPTDGGFNYTNSGLSLGHVPLVPDPLVEGGNLVSKLFLSIFWGSLATALGMVGVRIFLNVDISNDSPNRTLSIITVVIAGLIAVVGAKMPGVWQSVIMALPALLSFLLAVHVLLAILVSVLVVAFVLIPIAGYLWLFFIECPTEKTHPLAIGAYLTVVAWIGLFRLLIVVVGSLLILAFFASVFGSRIFAAVMGAVGYLFGLVVILFEGTFTREPITAIGLIFPAISAVALFYLLTGQSRESESDIDESYIKHRVRVARTIFSLGIAIAIGGALTVGAETTSKAVPLATLVGIFFFPLLGVTAVEYYNIWQITGPTDTKAGDIRDPLMLRALFKRLQNRILPTIWRVLDPCSKIVSKVIILLRGRSFFGWYIRRAENIKQYCNGTSDCSKEEEEE
jgi:hypothetical protein